MASEQARFGASATKPARGRLAIVLLALTAVVIAMTVYVATRRPPVDEPASETSRLTQSEQVLRAARPLVEEGQYAPAIAPMEAHLRQQSGDVEVRVLLAETLMFAQRLREAEQAVDDVLRTAPRNSQALWIKGLLVRRRAGDNAMEFFRQAAESPDVTPRVLAGYGLELLEAGQLDEAESYLRRARQLGLEDARTLGPLGDLALRKGDAAAAEPLLASAVRQDRANARLWAMLVEAQISGGKLDAARQTLSDALQACGEQVPLRMKLGEVLSQLDRNQEAGDAFAKAAAEAAEDRVRCGAWLRAGQAYFAAGRLDDAGKCATYAGAIHYQDAEVLQLKKQIEAASKP